MKFYPGEINIVCTNLQQSLTFYRDVLDFEVASEEDNAVHLRCGEQLYLLLPFAVEARPTMTYIRQPEFSNDLLVDDLPAAVAYLKEKGVTFAESFEEGQPNAIIRDPDGLVWEIIDRSL